MFVQRAFLTACIIVVAAGTSVLAADRSDDTDASSPGSRFVTPPVIIDNGIREPMAVPSAAPLSRGNHNCDLRVYIVEPVSRWKDYSNTNYEFGFLDFGMDTSLSLAYQETFQTTRAWHSPLGIGDVASDNIMVIAAIFSQEDGGTNYSDTLPVQGYPFTIHTADAAATATPGNPGWDTAYGGFTHTVFIEKATWGS